MNQTLTLIRRDPATQLLPWVMLAAFLSWFGYWKLHEGFSIVLLSATPWLLTFPQPQRRASLFEATLPIDGREFLRARIVSLLLYIWAPVGIELAGACLFGYGPSPVNFLRVVAGMLQVTALFVVCQTLFLPLAELTAGTNSLLWLASIFGALGAIFLPPLLLLPVVVALPIALGFWLAAAWPTGPFSFQYQVGTEPGDVSSVQVQERVATRGGFFARQAPLFRALYPWQSFMFLAQAAIYPFIGNSLLPLCFLPVFLGSGLAGMRWLGTLPIGRRRLMLCLLGPYLLVYTLAQVGDLNFGDSAEKAQQAGLEYRNGSVQVSPESPFLVLTERNSNPVITAPWGETYRPGHYNKPLRAYYNPWASGRENSVRFREWQFRRATLAAYGEEIPLERAAILPSLTPLRLRPVVRFLNVAIAVGLALVVVALLLIPNWSRMRWLSKKIRTVIVTTLGVSIFLSIVLLPMLARRPMATQLTDLVPLRVLQLIPASSPMVWFAPLAILLFLVWLIDLQFAELETGLFEMQPKSRWGAAA